MFEMKNNEYGSYLIDLKSQEAMHQYYGVKDRFEYTSNNKQQFIEEIASSIKSFAQKFDWIAIPESSNSFITDIVKQLNVDYFVIKKNNITTVISFAEKLSLQPKEKKVHIEKLTSMNVFKINLLKSNQRRKYEQIIFQENKSLQGKGLVIDDSLFSGTTLRALKFALPEFYFLAIFSK